MTANASPSRAMTVLFWSVPLCLLAVQAAYTLSSTGQIRHEELGASVCNPWWLEHRTVYDGTSTNLGWYALLLSVYNLFGFTLHTAKYVRLALHALSLLCLAKLLKDIFGARRAIVPLGLIGLSPTLLYFTTLQAEFGLGLQMLPIVLLLLTGIRFDRSTTDILRQTAFGALCMIAAMMYPAFLVALPALALLVLGRLGQTPTGDQAPARACLWYIIPALLGFLLPLAIAFLIVKDPQLLILDPHTGTGLFRGGGRVALDPVAWWTALSQVMSDACLIDPTPGFSARSYYYEVRVPDFSLPPAGVSVLLLLILGLPELLRDKRLRLPLAACGLLLVCALILPNLDARLPGLRRCTMLLAAVYALLALVWLRLPEMTRHRRRMLLICTAVLAGHHAVACAINYRALETPSPWRASGWFGVEETPAASLQYWLKHTEEYALVARDENGNFVQRPYSEIYAAIAGYRHWNGQEPKPIQAYYAKTGSGITLDVSLWEDYTLEH